MFRKIPIIIGPTCSGKTKPAINLAKKIDGEIIGLDSRQIYKNIPIGTAQPEIKELNSIKHHLVGCYNLNEKISAGRYAQLINKKIEDIKNKNKTPIICGGAGLYYRAFTKGIFSDSISDYNIRKNLNLLYDKNPSALLEKLQSIDLQYSKIVHINNKKRLVRALEIYQTTGVTPSQNFNSQKLDKQPSLDIFTVYLKWDQKTLDQRIIQRTNYMLKNGWIAEVESVKREEKIHKEQYSCLDSIGYNQIISYLNGHVDYNQMRNEIIIKTCQLSKKQWKWFKKEPINLFIEMNYLDYDDITKTINNILLYI